MLCKYPSQIKNISQHVAFPCGQCDACRHNRRRVWSHRIMLETRYHDSSTFLTLTYNDDHLPRSGSVNPQHHRDFIKRLRYHYSAPLRFYAVGEYGEKTERPHYHYALFGYPACSQGSSYRSGVFVPCKCKHCLLIQNTWSKGHIFNGSLTPDSADYIAGYINKKLTRNECNCQTEYHHPQCPVVRLHGRHPEFARMSNRPGIAAQAATSIAASLKKHGLTDLVDVPRVLVHNQKQVPLGRYLTDKIHSELEIVFQHGDKIKNFEKEVRSMLNARLDNQGVPLEARSPASALKFLSAQKILDRETKLSRTNKEKRL